MVMADSIDAIYQSLYAAKPNCVCTLKAARLFIVNVEFLFSTTNTTAVAFIVVLLQCTALTCANCSIAAV